MGSCEFVFLDIQIANFLCFAFLLPDSQNSKTRLYSGFNFALVAGFVTFTYLEPLFVPVGMQLAMVALYVLAINASLVGLSLGVLLPTLWPGVSFGVALALLANAIVAVPIPYFFPISAVSCAAVGALVSAR